MGGPRTVFVSFDAIGHRCLQALLELGADVAAVVTLPDRPSDSSPGSLDAESAPSGMVSFDEIAARADALLIKTDDINHPQCIEQLRVLRPDITFIIGWSQLARAEFIGLARVGTFGMHPTLLPKHRGRAPIPWAIIFGLRRTGVSLFWIDEGADSGDLVGQLECEITDDDDAGTLYEKLLELHVELIKRHWPGMVRGEIPRIPQDRRRASYWPRRRPADGIIDWYIDAVHLYDWVRALTRPYPGAFTFAGQRKIIVWKGRIADGTACVARPGEIVALRDDGCVVQTGRGLLLLTEIQPDGGSVLAGRQIREAGIFTIAELLG